VKIYHDAQSRDDNALTDYSELSHTWWARAWDLFSFAGLVFLGIHLTEAWCVMVSQGFIEVRDNHVRVLADEAIPASEIDVSKAERDLREAQEQMAHPAPDSDIEALLIRYRNATARIETARQTRC